MARPVLFTPKPEQSHGLGSPHGARSGHHGGSMSSSLYVGIDVAKAQLDIACRPTNARWTVPHTAGGIGRLVRRLSRLRPTLIVLEATGGLELSVASELAAA